MRVIHFVRDLDVASGGPSRSVPALSIHQSRVPGVNVSVCYQDRGNPIVILPQGEADFVAINRMAHLGTAVATQLPKDTKSEPDAIFHVHGLWNPLVHQAISLARARRIPYVVSSRGMLANWALGHKALKKKLAWGLYQKEDLVNAARLIGSSEFERNDIEGVLPGSKIEVIPNGCEDRPDSVPEYEALPSTRNARWALAMGRLHPVKGFAELIEAWAEIGAPGWKLVIAGPDENGYRSHLERLVNKLNLVNRVHFLGKVDDALKWSLFENCELLVAPSKTENFGMAIAEALLSGRPVITTTSTPWREIRDHECGWWINPDQNALSEALKQATAMDADSLRRMGARGRNLIQESYSWDQVAARTIELYRKVLSQTGHVAV